MQLAVEKYKMSERMACRIFKVSRAHWKEHPRKLPDENEVIARILALVSEYGRYGYRTIAELLRQDLDNLLHINTRRVGLIWKRFGLIVPRRQQKRKRLKQACLLYHSVCCCRGKHVYGIMQSRD